MRVLTILLGVGLVGMMLMCCEVIEPEPLEIEVKGEMKAVGEIIAINETTHDTVRAWNAITDNYLDACITFMSTGDIDQVRSIIFIHKIVQFPIIIWDTTAIATSYYAGGYDTTNYVQWSSGYKVSSSYDADTLKYWYLSPEWTISIDLSTAYATEINTLGMIANDSVTVYWSIYHSAKP